MLGGDPQNPDPVTPDDVHELHGMVVALTTAVQALMAALPDPVAARLAVRTALDAEMAMSLNPEHWHPAANRGIHQVFDLLDELLQRPQRRPAKLREERLTMCNRYVPPDMGEMQREWHIGARTVPLWAARSSRAL